MTNVSGRSDRPTRQRRALDSHFVNISLDGRFAKCEHSVVRITAKKRVNDFQMRFSDSAASLQRWHETTRLAHWTDFTELRQSFPSADQIGRRTVFNIAQNRYRLIARVNYRLERVFVLFIMTHKEHEKGEWKK